MVTLAVAAVAWRLCPDSDVWVVLCVVLWTAVWMTYLRIRYPRIIHKIWGAVQGNVASGPPLGELRV